MSRIVECVPNFSEGNDQNVIRQITAAAETVEGVKLLDVDPGKATNRTVVTFAGAPEDVVEAAFRAIKKACELIDMSRHKGAHPRFGATDVCPLVPIAGVTMEETVEYARGLARRVGEELRLPVYCYENAAFSAERQNLATIRSGEYEGLKQKLADPRWRPDFGPAEFNARSGATVIGARDFLVAYNINLNTTSTRRANAIAFDIREKGRVLRRGDPVTGEIVKDEKGNPVNVPGALKCVKGIGWFIEEYGIAQVSVNLTNISVTPIHVAFDEACRRAEARGLRVTGSEIVGLVPLHALLEAGRYFLRKQQRSAGVSDAELIKIAVKSLGLNDLYAFKPEEKVIEYVLAKGAAKRLVDLSLKAFVEEAASESPAPGGGSVSAAVGALGAALGTMVANLSAHKRGWDGRWEEFSAWAEKGKARHDELLRLIDEDTAAFNTLMAAFGLPKKSAAEQAERRRRVQAATRGAMEAPLRVMEAALASLEIARAMAEIGNPNSVSDAGVAALCARAAVRGAFLNVKTNAKGLEDKGAVAEFLGRGAALEEQARAEEEEILGMVAAKL
ncbi:MAG: glutamate formimidoyltransferase [Planctomycetes bacterium]|nr:glutamate formimidoyltransferase [Planctomycetota bacterium]